MPDYPIAGCQVSFPHEPYGVQMAFMYKLMVSLQQGVNALLEAPTGCGKTLSLLCSALAWQLHQKNLPPPVTSPTTGNSGSGDNPYDTHARNEGVDPQPAVPRAPKIPKIYFASRTHSQLKQVGVITGLHSTLVLFSPPLKLILIHGVVPTSDPAVEPCKLGLPVV